MAQTTCLYYNELSQLKGKNHQLSNTTCPSDPGSYVLAYTYDSGTNGMGRRTGMSVTNEGLATTWTYDANGQVASQADTRAGTVYTTMWGYNAQDQVRQMQYPTGETVVMTYTLQGLPQQLAPYVTNAEYNVAGQMTTLIQANTVTTTYAYHGLTQRLTQVQSTLGTTNLLKLGYSYDPVGNCRQVKNQKVKGKSRSRADCLYTGNFVVEALAVISSQL